MLFRHWAERMMDMCWEAAKDKSRKGRPRILTGTRTPQGPGEQPLSRPLTGFRTSVSFLLTTDLRMLTRGLGIGLEGLFSKLSGSVEEWPPFLACSASW